MTSKMNQNHYLDKMRKIHWGEIKLRTGGALHTRLVVDICLWAKVCKLAFATEVYDEFGFIHDIYIPELPYPFIEVVDTHRPDHLDKQIENLVKCINVNDPWRLT